MTERDAKKAAATFEFPPFHATAVQVYSHTLTLAGDHVEETGDWWLSVDDGTGKRRYFESPQSWLRYWNHPDLRMLDSTS